MTENDNSYVYVYVSLSVSNTDFLCVLLCILADELKGKSFPFCIGSATLSKKENNIFF